MAQPTKKEIYLMDILDVVNDFNVLYTSCKEFCTAQKKNGIIPMEIINKFEMSIENFNCDLLCTPCTLHGLDEPLPVAEPAKDTTATTENKKDDNKDASTTTANPKAEIPKRKRGRPRKNPLPETTSATNTEVAGEAEEGKITATPRTRKRTSYGLQRYIPHASYKKTIYNPNSHHRKWTNRFGRIKDEEACQRVLDLCVETFLEHGYKTYTEFCKNHNSLICAMSKRSIDGTPLRVLFNQRIAEAMGNVSLI